MTDERTRTVVIVPQDGTETIGATDSVAVEDPLEIDIGKTPLAVTMRTPGDDHDLAVGFLLTEGMLLGPDEVPTVDRIDDSRVLDRHHRGMASAIDDCPVRVLVSLKRGGRWHASTVRAIVQRRAWYADILGGF